MCVPSTTLVEIMGVCMETQDHSKVVLMFFSLQNLCFMGWMTIWQVASWGSHSHRSNVSFKSAGLHFKLCQRVWGFYSGTFKKASFLMWDKLWFHFWFCRFHLAMWIKAGEYNSEHESRVPKKHQLCCGTDTGIEPLITEPDGTLSSPTTKPIP